MKSTPLHTVLLGACLTALGASGVALAHSHEQWGHDDDDRDRHGHYATGHGDWPGNGNDVAAVDNPTYQEECGSCHMAYQPGLLPGAAWTRLMKAEALAGHFGDDASLDEKVRSAIELYLVDNAADRSSQTRARAFAVPAQNGSDPGALPRITATPYFLRKHHEIPQRMVAGNPQVKSFSQCNLCHRNAASGDFNEHAVDIPGYGSWHD